MKPLNTYYPYYLDALRTNDQTAGTQVIEVAHAAGLSYTDIYLAIMEPALIEIGEMWQRCELSVAQEHQASSITEALIGQFHQPAAALNGFRLLLAAAYPNQHHIGLRIVQNLFEQNGWAVRNLGASVLPAELKHHTRVFKPHLIGLSVAMFTHLPRLKESVHMLKARWPQIPIVVGGNAIKAAPQALREVGADHAVSNALEGLQLGGQIIADLRNSS